MGDFNVKKAIQGKSLQTFTERLLNDVQALEKMIDEGWFTCKENRIGAEQELCIVDSHYKPAFNNIDILNTAKNPYFTSEIAKFNLEINVEPLLLEKNCFSSLEKDLLEKISEMRSAAQKHGTDIIFTGILPTIRKSDVELSSVTPIDRYFALMDALMKLRGKTYELKISGIDELNLIQNSAVIEACNTGFQVHLQVHPSDFVNKYNIAQAIAAPVLSAAVNSPLLFGKRLWRETRIALFQQSVDTRSSTDHIRDRSPRVMFGNHWLEKSILEIYKEDIVRFRILLASNFEENALELVEKGITPKLKALTVHNSTIYRWNRPCYGINPDGTPHLRIENRVLPAGPTVKDEVANAAFWLGLMKGIPLKTKNITEDFLFEDARDNFFNAAQYGIEAGFNWTGHQKISAKKLIRQELLPIAHDGLKSCKVSDNDADKFLSIIDERIQTGQTGAHWIIQSYNKLIKQTNKDEALTCITSSIIKNQMENKPVHKWQKAEIQDLEHWNPRQLLVEEFMTTDIFTVRKNDIIALAADMMDWQKIRYIPVENDKGKLSGLITSRILLRFLRKNNDSNTLNKTTIAEIMIEKPITVKPDTNIMEAMDLMEKNKIGCLPVVQNGNLVGIVTEEDFFNLSKRIFKRL